MKRAFGSDNHSGVCPEVLQAIASANTEHALAYGDDEYCERVSRLFKAHFGEQAEVYFVFNGTGANVLNIDAMCRSHHAVICAESAHINVDECGAPQRIVGCRLLTVPTTDGKLTPELVKRHLHGFGFEHHSQPRAISITQSTELGTLYTVEEIKALADLAHSYDMFLHVDGARLANAAVALGCSFREMTTDAGVDCLSFGGTKNGLLMGESAVILNPELNKELKYRRKQMGQLCSKMRFMAVQFEAYFGNAQNMQIPLWRKNAEHSNQMAQILYNAIKGVPQAHVVYPVQVNSVFVRLPRRVWQELQNDYFFYDWEEDGLPMDYGKMKAVPTDVVRWMCSFDTTEEDVNNFISALKRRLAVIS